MLHTKFQAHGTRDSEEVDFIIYFFVFLWLEPRTPWHGAILIPGTSV